MSSILNKRNEIDYKVSVDQALVSYPELPLYKQPFGTALSFSIGDDPSWAKLHIIAPSWSSRSSNTFEFLR